MELKGRWDLFDYSHVSTILLVIFITVVVLEMLSQKLRTKTL
jgi:phosphonate transport system permease protein